MFVFLGWHFDAEWEKTAKSTSIKAYLLRTCVTICLAVVSQETANVLYSMSSLKHAVYTFKVVCKEERKKYSC